MSGAGVAKFPANLSKKPFEPLLFHIISLDSLGCCILNLFPCVTTEYIKLLEGPIVCLLGIKRNYFLEAIRTSLDTLDC
jgi:hypothetical protein